MYLCKYKEPKVVIKLILYNEIHFGKFSKKTCPQVFTVISPQVLDIEHWRNFIFVWKLQLVGILSNFLSNLERAIYPWLELSKLSRLKPILAKILVTNMLVVKKEPMTSSLDMRGSCFGKIGCAFLIVPFGIY